MKDLGAILKNDIDKIEHQLNKLIECNNDLLYDIKKFISTGSKRIRSIVTLLYLKANNVQISDEITTLLLCIELIHNASLLHDDVVDNSEFRRGSRTIYSKHNAHASILSGDYLLSLAIKRLLEFNNISILKEFASTTEAMSKAELIQLYNRNNDLQLDDYIDIITGKTASLFKTSLASAAILSDIDINKAKNFGKQFGILFQINNDMQPESINNDNLNGVSTIKDILGIEKAIIFKDNYKQKIRECLADIENNIYKQSIEDLVNSL